LAYDLYVDRYLPKMNEADCQDEIKLCDSIYDELTSLVSEYSVDEDMAYDIMDILSKTQYSTKKINMAQNLQVFFDYIG
jgi:hypothetical protein